MKEVKSFWHCISHSAEETFQIGAHFASSLPKNSVVAFCGELGAGKTAFIKGVATRLTGCQAEEISSPTFTYLNIYEGQTPVFHFDLYRLSDEKGFLSMGFEEYFYKEGVCCLEWSERISKLLPQDCYIVTLWHMAPQTRKIQIERGHV